VRAVVGYLARAGVIQPAPSAPDRVMGRVVGVWDRNTLAACKARRQEGTKVRWRQYRSVWAWVEGDAAAATGSCATSATVASPRRRARAATSAILAAPGPQAPAARAAAAPARAAAAGDCELDEAILDVVAAARARRRPHARGRGPARRALEGRREVLLRRPAALRRLRHLRADAVLERVDALLEAGTLRSTAGGSRSWRCA
jgi:ATP-dependent DNA helicase RecQ